ncbi:hypothetical protein BWI15_11635 [Kribbella sp. ALI-6-A]|uniref:DUF4386 family protein n=1 Tax=Kribbella sp. ALI-6-A TaxID=1933817 RepID=UPI00097C7653|nr:DUF4386 family protein [Kribbella sp. ALI-6-A]ONI74023.1 hypothetical protein BWI15_11635 [Kribbella sp. ALI-6-A]
MKPSMAIYLVSAPLVAVAARALMTPQYQDRADKLDTTRYLGALAEAGTRNDIGAMLGLLGAVLYVGAALALARIVRTRSARIGAALTIAGAFGLWTNSVFVLLVGRLAEEQDRQATVALLDRVNSAPVFAVFFLALIIGAVGSVVLAVALYRSRLVSRAAAVTAGVGGASLMITAPGPLLSFVLGGAVLALVGLTWVAASTTFPYDRSARGRAPAERRVS